jgi:hypothetical protein
MYPVGSILRHVPSTPPPAAAEAAEKLQAIPAPQKWYGEDWKTRNMRRLLTNQSRCKHYAAIVLKNGILQVKPVKAMFPTIAEWCEAMHERPESMDMLLDHKKALDALDKKKRSANRTLLKEKWKMEKARLQILAAEKRIATIEKSMEYHANHLC